MPWQPLLDGALAERARESVEAIVGDLAASDCSLAGGASLGGGMAGKAILHGYHARTEGRDSANAECCLQEAIATMTATPAPASLYGGLAGVGWALAHLQSGLPGLDGEDDLTEIDAVLREHLDQLPWAEEYDLINGLVGFGVYALERLPQPAAVGCLERVIDRLGETAERLPEGTRWWTNPDWLPAESSAKYPRGYYNLGLAHGVPGVIALLGCACATAVALEKARPLLDGAVRWLLAQDQPAGFPYWVLPDGAEETAARLAWCYGDPGVATALLVAARFAREQAWERRAVAIARRAAARPPEHSGVVDAGLCHGAAGLGHLFNRLFQATGEPELGAAARFWFTRTLEMRRPGRGIGGYEAWLGGDDGELTWVADTGLLTGAAGIALALLGATTAIEPAWDRMLLVAVPPTAV
jgi:hypothetical protein